MAYQDNNFDPRPIGVFDSGVGGLSVLNQLLNDFPHESFIYLGDTARLPYGSKSPQTIQKYVSQNINYLVKVKNVKAVIVACNSASTVLDDVSFDSKIPIFGVIKPGARSALAKSKNKKIAIWATRATVHQNSYEKALMLLDDSVHCDSIACPLLVPIVEEGLWSGDITDQVIDLYLNQTPTDVDTLILGCTHYPFIKPRIISRIQTLNRSQLQIVDSALALSTDLKDTFKNKILKTNSNSTDERQLSLLLTDEASHFMNLVNKAFPDWQNIKFQLIDLNQFV